MSEQTLREAYNELALVYGEIAGESKTKSYRHVDGQLVSRTVKLHENIVQEQCALCVAGIKHIVEFKHLPFGWLVEHNTVVGCNLAIERLASKTSAARMKLAALEDRKRRCFVKDWRDQISKEIAQVSAEIKPYEEKQAKLLSKKEQALAVVTQLELQINGLFASNAIADTVSACLVDHDTHFVAEHWRKMLADKPSEQKHFAIVKKRISMGKAECMKCHRPAVLRVQVVKQGVERRCAGVYFEHREGNKYASSCYVAKDEAMTKHAVEIEQALERARSLR